MEQPSINLTYVMGQLNVQFTSQQLAHITNHYTGQQARLGRINLWTPPQPLTLNLRFNQASDCPYKPVTPADHHWLKNQLTEVGLFFDDGLCDLEDNTQLLLSDAQLQQIKASSKEPNVTLFIHGYNVGWGEYGKQLYTSSQSASTSQQVAYQPGNKTAFNPQSDILYFSTEAATIYRNVTHQYKQFSTAAHALRLNDDRLNGEGAHNWWLHMEYNLNRAAGFNGFDYLFQKNKPHYTRILNVAWSGDPVSALDYMAIEPMADITARALLPALVQLHEQHIQINIIAHSAGNIVLLKVMEVLGKEPRYHNLLNHVFMWQAAMPNNVLSPNAQHEDDSLTGFWRTPHAYLSARKIHVLYSQHDNILGPIPFKVDGTKDKRLYDKWRTPGGGKGMALAALSLDIIDQKLGVPNALRSGYHVAHLFHVPFSALLYDAALRNALYEKWVTKYAHRLDNAHHCATLSDQVGVIQQEYHQTFQGLALFISLFSAIKHDGMLAFLANLKNDQRLAQFLVTLPALLAQQLMTHITHAARVTIDHQDWQRIYSGLSHYAQTHLSFSYLKSLWNVMMQGQGHWLQHSISDIKKFLFSKMHDMLLPYPYQIFMKNTQLQYYVFCELIRYYQQHHVVHQESLSVRGAALARRGSEVAAFMITVLNTPGAEPRPALGYSGIDASDVALNRLVEQGKIITVDQSDYLLHHSAMKVSDFKNPVFRRVYQGVIMQADGMHFGEFM
ncbi:MAG: hypothetical protein COB66_02910 [Coxiella sp. (in: Bacteria)]|nr:MAG: hypothetical protein COB66_02910 [Coxiella sp. (in: g-proteobacteria)]